SPPTAASAAACATFPTFDVECDCRFVAAAVTSGGAIIQPTRQPVIAYVLATPFRITHRSMSSGTRPGIEEKVCPPYVRCSYISSVTTQMPCSSAHCPIASTSAAGYTAPVGLLGETNSSAFVRDVRAASS